jgi:prepilin-type N-terminal cleavage/methylation domain-containing protein
MFKFKNKNLDSGFTLLEILLVVGIIAILAGIVIVAINPSRQLAAARDTERRSDLKQINNALLQYYIDNQSFPESVASETLTEICNSGSHSQDDFDCPPGTIDLSVLVPKYLSAIPADPNGHTATTTGYHIALNGSHKPYLKAPNTEVSGTYIAIGSGTGVVDISIVGTGTLEDPFRIYNCTGLQNMNNDKTASYLLIDDIDCGAFSGFNPIGPGYNAAAFTGSLDGAGHLIENVTVDGGLFGVLTSGAEISNLRLGNINVPRGIELYGVRYAGALVGITSGSRIENISIVSGSVTGTSYTGGIIGSANSGTVLANSYAIINVSGGSWFTGGLMGYAHLSNTVQNSYFVGSLTANNLDYAGCLVGNTSANITVTSSYYNSGVCSFVNGFGVGKATEEMKTQSTFSGWDFTDIWAISGSVNSGYPYLR